MKALYNRLCKDEVLLPKNYRFVTSMTLMVGYFIVCRFLTKSF